MNRPLLFAMGQPLVERFRLGEGALLAVNMSYAAIHPPRGGAGFLLVALVSSLVLAAMYLLNDLVDVDADRSDPKKNPALVALLIDNRRFLVGVLALQHAAYPLLAWWCLGGAPAVAVTIVLGLNLAYSLGLKRVPVLDTVWVGAWGAAFAAIAISDLLLLAAVGAMTGISHLFQVYADRDVDRENRVRTTAVSSPGLYWPLLAAWCGLLAAILWLWAGWGPATGIVAVVPLAARIWRAEPRVAWLASKLAFGLIWLKLLAVW